MPISLYSANATTDKKYIVNGSRIDARLVNKYFNSDNIIFFVPIHTQSDFDGYIVGVTTEHLMVSMFFSSGRVLRVTV